MLVSHQERPRELKWYHAGPMLYGDWGTSRFYVLGLAFYFAMYASFWYIVGVGLLVAAVGWAYTVVCRVYPDGGGVYSAARQLSPLLSVIGALLLFADYAVTAALSAYEGISYFHEFSADYKWMIAAGAIASIAFLGAINYIGPKRAGTFALIVAMATLALTLVMTIFAIPHMAAGWHAFSLYGSLAGTGVPQRWTTLVNVVLALSGVEAIANMTGIMVQPVSKTSKKSIWPVLLEVVVLNIVLGVAMLALPVMLNPSLKGVPPEQRTGEFSKPAAQYDIDRENYRHDHPDYAKNPEQLAAYKAMPEESDNERLMQTVVLRVMGEQFIGHWFGVICGVVFGLLLLSAVNTVIGGMMSVGYVMARDSELPRMFTKLNLFGVPWVGLIPAMAVPTALLLLFDDLDTLADLYAIGVVGAIAINLSCCTVNAKLPVKMWERVSIGLIAAVMIAIEMTLAVEKPHALIFVGIILTAGLGARYFTKIYLPKRARKKTGKTPAPAASPIFQGVELHTGERLENDVLPTFGTPPEELDMSKPHVMVATRGGARLMNFAADYAKQVGANLFVIFVRQLIVQFSGPGEGPSLDEDSEAQAAFKLAEEACKKRGVAMMPIYVVSRDVADSILDFAATYDVKALLMGVSRQGTILRALRGDVLVNVADKLPEDIPLLIHA